MYVLYRWVNPFVDPRRALHALPGCVSYLMDWMRYRRMEGAEKLMFRDSYPSLHDRTATTPFDPHYFYQDIWAFRKVSRSGVSSHVDVASRIDFAGFLTAICQVTFVDIRPLVAQLENFTSRKGSILALPFADASVQSLSCLHVAEHVGLGRYGDPLDPAGTRKACYELARVLAPGGNLYFSLPVGKPRLCFNAHRIHSPRQIQQYFAGLQLVELSGIDDRGNFLSGIDVSVLADSDYACGLFHFTKRL